MSGKAIDSSRGLTSLRRASRKTESDNTCQVYQSQQSHSEGKGRQITRASDSQHFISSIPSLTSSQTAHIPAPASPPTQTWHPQSPALTSVSRNCFTCSCLGHHCSSSEEHTALHRHGREERNKPSGASLVLGGPLGQLLEAHLQVHEPYLEMRMNRFA
ncbi:hypothetical protein VTI74DRAFT_7754 [Chaetomium olivicolor]